MFDKEYLTTKEVAIALGLSTSSIQKLVNAGSLDAWITPGGHRRIHRRSVEAVLSSRETGLRGISIDRNIRVLLICEESAKISLFKANLSRVGHSVQIYISDRNIFNEQECIYGSADIVFYFTNDDYVESSASIQLLLKKIEARQLILIGEESFQTHRGEQLGTMNYIYCERQISADRLCGYLDMVALELTNERISFSIN